METPVCDFLRAYAESDTLRLHMPGHKGTAHPHDITEIHGADSLYEADGILAASERNASELFGADTFYSTEGSSLAIRAMLYLAVLHAKQNGKPPRIAAARNAHKVFLSAAALLDFEVCWLTPHGDATYLSCPLSPETVEETIRETQPTAVYLTSPDYLGHVADIAAIAAVCHRHRVLLLVDNAHGAYLKFLSPSRHPMDLGADLCSDSAHKTLPVLTGGAYLHIAKTAPAELKHHAKTALALFDSTSPSYLILQSLDKVNAALATDYPARLAAFIPKVAAVKERLISHGYAFTGDEPLKLTLLPKSYGYTGTALADELRKRDIECEFADPDHTVLMLTPETGDNGLARLEAALTALPKKEPLTATPPAFYLPEQVTSVREATLSPMETVAVANSVGRICAAATVACPPAVPLIVCGERIDRQTLAAFTYYGVDTITVIKNG